MVVGADPGIFPKEGAAVTGVKLNVVEAALFTGCCAPNVKLGGGEVEPKTNPAAPFDDVVPKLKADGDDVNEAGSSKGFSATGVCCCPNENKEVLGAATGFCTVVCKFPNSVPVVGFEAFEAPKLNKEFDDLDTPKDPTVAEEVTGEVVGELISTTSWLASGLDTNPLLAPKSGTLEVGNSGKAAPNNGSEVVVVTAEVSVVTAGNEEPKENNGAVAVLISLAVVVLEEPNVNRFVFIETGMVKVLSDRGRVVAADVVTVNVGKESDERVKEGTNEAVVTEPKETPKFNDALGG